ncbi:MAG: hypothetical protein M0P12_11250 [Paludibacteraceae bacterium]|nr:hypothetical protein [Paludibacteraceae bacterium]
MGKICFYTMTHDTGFAPNPFFDYLTLATCKPQIRKSKNVKSGDWIAGWSGKRLQKKGEGKRLIYLARISEKISYNDYWNDKRFEMKKPIMPPEYKKTQSFSQILKDDACHSSSCGARDYGNFDNEILYLGDNIYYDIIDHNGISYTIQLENKSHGEDLKEHDVNGENVIICEEFYYFGEGNYLDVNYDGIEHYKPGRCSIFLNDQEKVDDFISYVRKHKNQAKIVGK